MMQTLSSPRFTDSIRIHCHVTDPILKTFLTKENQLSLIDKQKLIDIQKEEENTLNWSHFTQFLHNLIRNNKETSTTTKLATIENLWQKFYKISIDICGNDRSSSLLSVLPVTIFCELLQFQCKSVSQFHFKQQIEYYFHTLLNETIQPAHLNQLIDIFSKFHHELFTQEEIDSLIKYYQDQQSVVVALGDGGQEEVDIGKKRQEFGKDIHFKFPKEISMEESETRKKHLIMFQLPKKIAFNVQSVSFQPIVKSVQQQEQKQAVSTSQFSYDEDDNWLLNQLTPFATNLHFTPHELANAVFELLIRPHPDEEIQNDLFELIGYDGFDVIQKILQKRPQILKKQLNDRVVPQRDNQAANLQNLVKHSGGDLTQAMNRAQQEMKNISRTSKMNQLDSNNRSTLPSTSTTSNANRSYPYVFDRMLNVKASAAFVANTRISLPDNIKRNDFHTYEEIVFPPTSPDTDKITEKFGRIKISDQDDDILKMAFKGTKELNLIQTVVFDTAYGSNENMLVSAPTGAGKTNVAMLCILHEIKQHIGPGNVIKTDEFKIIYVAPMKALAAEMTRNFGQKLAPLGIIVRECTGDMSLTKSEIQATQMLVTTPEKWDVMTRKSTGDVALVQLVRLLIIDEVHLLHEDRGAVIESIVARTLRQVESSQSMIRILGLSATLPNYLDVARFLLCNPYKSLFYFDSRFRPVPLGQTFIGVKSISAPDSRPTPGGLRMQQLDNMNQVCYNKVLEQVRNGEQVMVFVHARNETYRTARYLREMARRLNHSEHFHAPEESLRWHDAQKQAMRSRDAALKDLFNDGFACHHAGMLRPDRSLVEQLFSDGHIRVLCCTATLAWGVNLPAHCVIIKGTDIYDAEKSSFVDLGILDVLQIFGRAGRPQFDKVGFGIIITTHEKLSHYLSLITRQNPIESQFHHNLADHLNAEIALGTVTNMDEAVQWLKYTYLFVRMCQNPLVYGATQEMLLRDPELRTFREELITVAARRLDFLQMIRFDERTGYLAITDLGRTASHFYIKNETVETWNEIFQKNMIDYEVFNMVAKSHEFSQIKVREEENTELMDMLHEFCECPPHADLLSDTIGKVNVLLQSFISKARVNTFSLVSDQNYIQQNASRLVRCLFEISLRRGWPSATSQLLRVSKMLEKRIWSEQSPLYQFEPEIRQVVLEKISEKHLTIESLREMDTKELGDFIRDHRYASEIKRYVSTLPNLQLSASTQTITRSIVRVRLLITANFHWSDRWNSRTHEPFWIWVEDPQTEHIYHSEYFLLSKKQVMRSETAEIVFTIPIFDPIAPQYYIRVNSDRWLGCDFVLPISFRHLILPHLHLPHTDLLDLEPLPITALHDDQFQSLYKYSHFNPIQTQIFHTLYHSDENVLLGAPTGSGKTVAAELAIFRVFKQYPNKKCVYIAPLKALVRERVDDWKIRLEEKLGKKVVELTGDVAPDMRAVAQSHLIVTTPEKWDGISRSWQQRHFVQDVALLVIDEIHLLGEDRGPVLEVIVSRVSFISSHTQHKVRIVGLSTAVANASDLGNWLNIQPSGMFNFRPSVRPVPLEVHIQGFPGRHYCPRMATMNKPIFQAIRTHSPAKPVLIFVSSRRQTRITALDLIAYLAADDNPKQWLHMPESEITAINNEQVRDSHLKLTLVFGIGMHHAGLTESDRKIVEHLFVNQRIQLLIATSTLAWGVNYPAHLVIVKGTEYFDGKSKRYVDFPITDVMQMMGRAGRPQFDNSGKAVIMVHDVKKHFYKRFLYEPFPVESSLLEVLPDHLNAEIVAGTITTKQDALDYLTWTFFFRRLIVNPSYYNLETVDGNHVNEYLSKLIQNSLQDLEKSSCICVDDDEFSIEPLTPGRIASYYYLNHKTIRLFQDRLHANVTLPELIDILSNVHEFAELPVRHNEDQLNLELSKTLRLPVNAYSMDSPHTKANLLLQAHFSRSRLPISDYITDTKLVLDQAIRIIQAMIDTCADRGWLITCIQSIQLIQMIIQSRWISDHTLLQLPFVEDYMLTSLHYQGHSINSLPQLIDIVCKKSNSLHQLFQHKLPSNDIDKLYAILMKYPLVEVSVSLQRSGNTDTTAAAAAGGGAGNEHQNNQSTSIDLIFTDRKQWIPVDADEQYVLNINLKKLTNQFKAVKDTRANAPKFPKPKDENWIVLLGNAEKEELLVMKRVNALNLVNNRLSLVFFTPENAGRVCYQLYLFSDCYMGLDQQFNIQLDVKEETVF